MRKKFPKTWWNYRVIKRGEGEDTFYGIYEAYYNSEIEEKPWTMTENPIHALGDTPEELKKDLELMLRAFEMDILTYENINPQTKGD